MKEGLAVNRGERMRWRAFNIHARRGEFERYWALVNLSLELGEHEREGAALSS